MDPLALFKQCPVSVSASVFQNEKKVPAAEGSVKKAMIPFFQTDMNLILKFKAC